MPLRELVVDLSFDDSPLAQAFIHHCDPGVTPAETYFLYEHRLCPGLSHQKHVAPFELAIVQLAIALANLRSAVFREAATPKSFLRRHNLLAPPKTMGVLSREHENPSWPTRHSYPTAVTIERSALFGPFVKRMVSMDLNTTAVVQPQTTKS